MHLSEMYSEAFTSVSVGSLHIYVPLESNLYTSIPQGSTFWKSLCWIFFFVSGSLVVFFALCIDAYVQPLPRFNSGIMDTSPFRKDLSMILLCFG